MDDAMAPRPSRLAAASGAAQRSLPVLAGGSPGSQARNSTTAARGAGIRVDRAVSELRRGRPVSLSSGSEQILVAAVETMQPYAWAYLSAGASQLNVTLTAERALASGWYQHAATTVASDAKAVPLPLSPAASVAATDALAPAPMLPITLRLPEGFDPAKLADLAGLGTHNEAGLAAESGDATGTSGGGTQQAAQRWASLLAVQSAAPA
ncbi:MAG TPA: hypothetical protein VEY69_05020, partial [Lautropia sp.]|nr:hypothetical protein [Lautropia sp.]